MSNQIEMPRYKCHKEVWALKIKDVIENTSYDGSTLAIEDDGFAPIIVSGDYVRKHNPTSGGYYVVYKDGYKSFSPAEAFEEGYTKGDLDVGVAPIGSFSWALMRLKDGAKVARRGWNGADMLVYFVPGGTYPAQTEAIKGIFPDDMVPYRPYYALKTAQNDVATWTPSGSDTLAEDWEEIE